MGARLPQASAVPSVAGVIVVCDLPAGRLGLLLAGRRLARRLYVSLLLAGEWLDGLKRAWVPLLLSVIAFYNFRALRYDQNSALIPLWAFTTWAFMRSLETRHYAWGVLTGIGTAAALLTKYWSVFLVLALAVAALSHRNRASYFRSPAPWIAALLGLLGFAPHVAWLVQEHFPPSHYVAGVRTAQSLSDWLRSVAEYSFGTAGYAAFAFALVVAGVRPSRAAIYDTLWPADAQRRTAAILFLIPLLLPISVAAITGARLLSLWSMPALGLLPVVLLMSPLIVVPRRAVVYTAAIAMAVTGSALVASPVVAWWQLSGASHHSNHVRLLASKVEAEWRRTTSQPLKSVGGLFVLAAPISFYLQQHPRTYYLHELRYNDGHYLRYLARWADRTSIMRDGIAVACPTGDDFCTKQLNKFLMVMPHAQRREVVLRRRWFGFEGPPARFTIVVVQPSSGP
jgi:hypothetical protein